MMYPEKDNDVLLRAAIFWRYSIVKILNQKSFSKYTFSCKYLKSLYRKSVIDRDGRRQGLPLLLAASIKMSSCTEADGSVLVGFNGALSHVVFIWPFLNLEHVKF